MRLRDVFFAGNFVEGLPTGSSRYVSVLYKQAREAEQAYASYRDAVARGDTIRVRKIVAAEGKKLGQRGRLAQATQVLSALNQQAKRIEADAALSSAEKRERLQQIEKHRHEVARRATAK